MCCRAGGPGGSDIERLPVQSWVSATRKVSRSAKQSCSSESCSRQRQKAGLGRLTWHQFRHIHSSLLNDLRVPAKIAQEQLGHASISTTLNVYTHVVEASDRSAVEAVEDRLFVELISGFKPGMEVLQISLGC